MPAAGRATLPGRWQRSGGLCLTKLADVPALADAHRPDAQPRLMARSDVRVTENSADRTLLHDAALARLATRPTLAAISSLAPEPAA
jgi:hypothetical protein